MAFKRLSLVVVFLWRGCNECPQASMEGRVVGGDYAPIGSYPHSAFLAVACARRNKLSNWICGASILNQHFTLTAGHCLEDCLEDSKVSVAVGSAEIGMGVKSSASAIRVHESFDSATMRNDIAVVQVRTPIKFNHLVKRVVLSRNPPYNEAAFMAGWGIVDETRGLGTRKLKHVRQTLWSRGECMRVLRDVPAGAICAGAKNADTNFAASGDSGSALMVRGYIQVGLVSYKLPRLSNSLAIYTEVKYFYDWIGHTILNMYCAIKM